MQILGEKLAPRNEDVLKIEFTENKLNVRLLIDYWVKFAGFGRNSIVTVPKGYLSDGMSIPRLLQPFIGEPFEGNTLKAALVHDYLCYTEKMPQMITHCLFRVMLIRDGVHPVRAWACWLGVVLYNVLKNYILTHPSRRWKL